MPSILDSFPDQDGVQHGPYLPLTNEELALRITIPGESINEQALHQLMQHARAVDCALRTDRISYVSGEVLVDAINIAMVGIVGHKRSIGSRVA